MQYKDILRRRWKLCIEYEDLRKQSSQAVIIPREYCRPTWEKLCLQGKDIVKSLSRVQLFVTPWTVAYEAPRSMGFSRQEYWSVLPFPSPGDHPNPGNEPGSPALQAESLPSEPLEKPKCFYYSRIVSHKSYQLRISFKTPHRKIFIFQLHNRRKENIS